MAELRVSQRKPPQGQGLPGSACADDLFSRIDALPGSDDKFPVLTALGWTGFDPGQWRPNSWVDNTKKRFGPGPGDSKIIQAVKETLTAVLLAAVWVLALGKQLLMDIKLVPGACGDKRLRQVKGDIAAKEMLASISMSNPESATAIDEVAKNYLCPTRAMTMQTAIGGWLTGVVGEVTISDYSRAEGWCDQEMLVQMEIQKRKLDENQLADREARGKATRTQTRDGFHRLGWIQDQTVDQWIEGLEFWPQPEQIVSWLKKGIIGKPYPVDYQLALDFDQQTNEQTAALLAGKHVSLDDARRMWADTYSPIDPQTAFDLWRRSQAGALDGAAKFTDDDLRQAIRLSPIPPIYRPAMFETRWQPLGIRQLKTAFDFNEVDENDLDKALTIAGFGPDAREQMIAQFQKQKPSFRRKWIGATGSAGMVKLFASGAIGQAELIDQLVQLGFDESEIEEAIVISLQERLWKHREEIIKFLKARYIKGEVDDSQVQGVLSSMGLDASTVGDLLSLWRIEFEVHPKQESASTLTQWYVQGIINEAQLVAYLTQLRYAPADIARMIGAADLKTLASTLKAAEGLVTRAEKSLTKEEKEWSAEIKAAEKLYGKVEQRTKTEAGKMLNWVKTNVTGPPKPVSKRVAPAGGAVAPTAQDEAEAAAFVEGENQML